MLQAMMATKSLKNAGVDSGADIFSSDLTWDPKLAKNVEPHNVMDDIVDTIGSWLHVENFTFWTLPKYRPEDVCEVSSVTTLLFTVTEFLKLAEESENQLIHKLMSASIQSEHTQLKYVWWSLGSVRKDRTSFAETFLGRRLHEVLLKYRGSRNALSNSVEEQLVRIKTWAGAYSNGQAACLLEDVHQQLCDVHRDFQAWQAAVSVAVIRKGWGKYNNRLISLEDVERELESMARKIKRPSTSPDADPLDMPKKQDCSRECITNTEFLHFTRGQPLECPEIRRSVIPIRSEFQRKSAVSEADSGLSASPPTPSHMSSSWPDSDFCYISANEIPVVKPGSLLCNNGVPSRRITSPESPVVLQIEDSSVSENDAEDLSEVFGNFMALKQEQPSWIETVDVTDLRHGASHVEMGYQEFPSVITGETNSYFWQNIRNLARISDHSE